MSCQGPTLVSEGGGGILAGTAPVGTVGRHELVAQGSSMGLGSGVEAQGSSMGLGSDVAAQGSSTGLGSSMTARTAARSSSASITTLQKSIEETTMNMEATLDLSLNLGSSLSRLHGCARAGKQQWPPAM